MKNALNKLVFFKVSDERLYLQLDSGICPVAYFSANLKVNGRPFRADFSLDYDGKVQHSDCPFEELCVDVSRIYINGEGSLLTGIDHVSVQGVLRAVIPAPGNEGNQYLVVFIDQRKKLRVYTCTGTSKELGTIYNALAAIESCVHEYGESDQEITYEG